MSTDEDKIKQLFDNYSPELSSDTRFMERLERNIEVIETIRRQNRTALRRNRFSMLAAGISGFVAGVIFTLCYPFITGAIAALGNSLPQVPFLSGEYTNISAWIIIGMLTLIITAVTYDLSASSAKNYSSSFNSHS